MPGDNHIHRTLRGRSRRDPIGTPVPSPVPDTPANREEPAVSSTDDLLAENASYAADFAARGSGSLSSTPQRRIAVVACMDARLDVYAALGLSPGDAHVIRNAGGVVTDDVIRSLAISQRLLGTEEIVLVHHTDCGMLTFGDDEFRASIERDTGIRPPWAAEAFGDLEGDVRQSIARIRASPFIPNKQSVRGFVYEVETGRLREVA
jgi:carbonic anhydrase